MDCASLRASFNRTAYARIPIALPQAQLEDFANAFLVLNQQISDSEKRPLFQKTGEHPIEYLGYKLVERQGVPPLFFHYRPEARALLARGDDFANRADAVFSKGHDALESAVVQLEQQFSGLHSASFPTPTG